MPTVRTAEVEWIGVEEGDAADSAGEQVAATADEEE